MSLAAAPPTSDRMSVSSKPSQNSSSKSGPRSKRTFIDSLNLSRERESPSLMRSKKPIGHSFKNQNDVFPSLPHRGPGETHGGQATNHNHELTMGTQPMMRMMTTSTGTPKRIHGRSHRGNLSPSPSLASARKFFQPQPRRDTQNST